MKRLLCFSIKACKSTGVRIALFAFVLLLLWNVHALSQTLQKPIEGDSLSFTGFVTLGYGFGSLDVEQLNQVLKKSNLSEIKSSVSFYNLNAKLPIGKNFLLGSDIKSFSENSSLTRDTSGSFVTKIQSLEAGINLGYLLVQNSSVIVAPSVGFAAGFNLTDIYITGVYLAFPRSSVKDELLNGFHPEITKMVSYINLSIELEAYFKLFGFGVKETPVQELPNKPVSIQNRGELWLGGFVSYNPLLTSNFVTGTSDFFSSASLGYKPSTLNYGVRLMFTTSLRLIVP
ncbi:MAG: hypothetical protein HYZ54_03495 [Ignavibacteriae bacterium]|nr:hypothetical protein [Ignavibacteriota bacterium]